MQTTERFLLNEAIHNYSSPSLRFWLTLKNRTGQMPPEMFVRLLGGWQPESILEMGTGYGILANYLALRYREANVLGVDLNPRRIQAAQATVKGRTNIDFRCQDILTLEESAWDCLVMVDVLHHVGRRNQEPLVRKSWRLLKPGGRFLLREIDAGLWLKAFNAYVFDALFYWEISHFLSISTLRTMLEDAGYRNIEVYPDYPHSSVFPYVTYVACKD